VVQQYFEFLVLLFVPAQHQNGNTHLERHLMRLHPVIGIASAATLAAAAWAMPAMAHGNGETVTQNFQQRIPNIPGKSLVAVVVDYEPGAASPSHRHARSAFIYGYVVSGAIESQVNDEPKTIYRAGQSFSEPPGALHATSRNASRTEPAKLLAVFIVDTGDKALTTPVDSPAHKGVKP
jgi:quercetin dioxygenase-like cupin family protein